ncbi:magnesium transporter [Arboricoccus pini]|uniref:Magnesium transporter MgtE n=1 Tax=Arboricoccus pini TaxID=1963835 RepID=A0A212R9I8_9PROT|nr:magnesium transporter [Arboricoccus pini]SNB68793.1 magnesium transporter [Arboricoccus pini]
MIDDVSVMPASVAPAPEQLDRLHNADLIARLNEASLPEAEAILSRLDIERVAELFDQPELERAVELILAISRQRALAILTDMAEDRAADLLLLLRPEERARFLRELEPAVARAIGALLAFPPHTAGSMMATEFVVMPATATVAETLAHLRHVERTRETIYAIFVVEPKTRHLIRAVTLRQLIVAAPDDLIVKLEPRREPPVTVEPHMDREEVARLIRQHDLLALPVVDHRRQILGIVTIDDVIDAIMAEGDEDVHRFGGVEAFDDAKPYLKISFLTMIKKRAGWLCVLFLSEMLTASAMQHFADELQRAVVLTLFIPLIMSSGGNSGSQATSLLIRALALGQLRLRDWWRVVIREIPTGIVLGIVLAVLGMVRITVWQQTGIFDYGPHWQLVAVTIGAGLVGIVTFGSLAGSMLPFALKRLGFDPASASAPLVATLVDVTGLVIYFSIASLILKGTLL